MGYRGKIQWSKDGQPLQNGKKVRISKKGILKIRATTYSDRGTYTCIGMLHRNSTVKYSVIYYCIGIYVIFVLYRTNINIYGDPLS